jgi:hypothetical protein
VEVPGGPRVVARHERAAGKYAETLVLDHYLEVLRRKLGVLPGATTLARPRAAGTFTAAHRRTGTPPAANTATRPGPGR